MTAGSDYTITTTFRDAQGALADPDDVTALVQAPDGTQSTPTPTSTTTGIWTTTGPTTVAGLYFAEIVGTSATGNVVDLVSWCVEPGLVAIS